MLALQTLVELLISIAFPIVQISFVELVSISATKV
jgi:hypothetical protein